jgi:hypothetical protein
VRHNWAVPGNEGEDESQALVTHSSGSSFCDIGVPQFRLMCRRSQIANCSASAKRKSPGPARHGSELMPPSRKAPKPINRIAWTKTAALIRNCGTKGRGLSSWKRHQRASRSRTQPIRRRRRVQLRAYDSASHCLAIGDVVAMFLWFPRLPRSPGGAAAVSAESRCYVRLLSIVSRMMSA